jgi:predicted ABC-type ATPase
LGGDAPLATLRKVDEEERLGRALPDGAGDAGADESNGGPEVGVPNLFIIAGPNGAGKTTYARDFLPAEMRCHEFVNADLIAAGLSPFNPASAEFEAGRIMVRRLKQLFAERADFAFETTLSSYGYVSLLEDMRQAGYRIRLDFLWVPDLEITRRRVRSRVVKGGHDIPEEVQRRRFGKGIRLLAEHYRSLVHWWRLYDNSGESPHLVAQEKDGVFEAADAARLALLERSASVRFMPATPSGQLAEPAVMTFEEETRRSVRAMRRAYARVVLENKAWGLPVIQWRDGIGVVEVPPEQLEPLARRILEVNGDPLPAEEERELLRHLKI